MYSDTTALEKIEALNKRINIIQGGTSAGKTISILIMLLDLSFEVYDKTIHIVSDTFPNLRHGAMKDWQKILKGTQSCLSAAGISRVTVNVVPFPCSL